MSTTAIICEFNPIHSGHKKLIEYAKTFSDNVVCIMSGNFTQRGLPACADKFSRAKHAILTGADLVIELPTVFAVSPANIFARGGVALANRIDADYLLFGSECGDIGELKRCLELTENSAVNENIKKYMEKGYSYPKAVYEATKSPILEKPNNTLAIEYLRAIAEQNSKITPVTLKRESDYNSETEESSTALRNDPKLLKKFSFRYVQKDLRLSAEKKFCEFATVALSLKTEKDYENIHLVTEGIENRFIKADKSNGYDAMLEQVKNKRFTRIKLQRIVLNCILNITNDDVENAFQNSIEAYPLAVKKGSEDLLALTDKTVSPLTRRADDLYSALSGKKTPVKLQIF